MNVKSMKEIKQVYKWMKLLGVESFHVWIPEKSHARLVKAVTKAGIPNYVNGSFSKDTLGLHLTFNPWKSK